MWATEKRGRRREKRRRREEEKREEEEKRGRRREKRREEERRRGGKREEEMYHMPHAIRTAGEPEDGARARTRYGTILSSPDDSWLSRCLQAVLSKV